MKNKNITRALTLAILSDYSFAELRAFGKNWGIKLPTNKVQALTQAVNAVQGGMGRISAEIMVKPNHNCLNEVEEALTVKKVYSYKPARIIKLHTGETPEYFYNKV